MDNSMQIAVPQQACAGLSFAKKKLNLPCLAAKFADPKGQI